MQKLPAMPSIHFASKMLNARLDINTSLTSILLRWHNSCLPHSSHSPSSLTLITQKNGVKGEKLSHATNGQPSACPVRAVTRCIIHLNQHNAPPSTRLHTYYDARNRRRAVSSTMITSILRAAALCIPGHAGVDPSNIATRSLRASGASMALLLDGMDPDKIRIVGRWRSDAMFRYLHAHALPLIQ